MSKEISYPSSSIAILEQLLEPLSDKSASSSASMQKHTLSLKKQVRNYILSCRNHCCETDYFAERGLSRETIQRFNLGYDPEKRLAIIPFGMVYYLARKVDIPADGVSSKFVRPHGLRRPLFNIGALTDTTATHIFLTESPIDAMSIIEAGGSAIAIGGLSTGYFARALDLVHSECWFVLAFGNTVARRKLRKKVEGLLQERSMPCAIPMDPVFFITRDANAALLANPEALAKGIRSEQKRLCLGAPETKTGDKARSWRSAALSGEDALVKGACQDTPARYAPSAE